MKIKVSEDFATAPGSRYISEGINSGQEFRQKHLLPAVQKAIGAKEKLEVDLDGTSGYGTSFLEEAFGGLIREDGLQLRTLSDLLIIISNEEPQLLDEIRDYMEAAERVRKKGHS